MPLSCAAARAEADSVAMRRNSVCGDGPGETGAQGFALDVLHDEVDFARVGEDVVDGGDAGVVERGGALAFVQEALAVGFGGGALGALDGDEAAKGGVARAVDLAHAAGAEAGLDVKTAGENAVDSGKQPGARAQVTIERRGIGHCGLSPGGGLLS